VIHLLDACGDYSARAETTCLVVKRVLPETVSRTYTRRKVAAGTRRYRGHVARGCDGDRRVDRRDAGRSRHGRRRRRRRRR
jgi:hypothetical protein